VIRKKILLLLLLSTEIRKKKYFGLIRSNTSEFLQYDKAE